jgi:hypothetical protein
MPGQSLVLSEPLPRSRWRGLDFAGMFLSGLCVLHCLAMPVMLFALPLAGAHFHHTGFHAVLAPIVGLVAMVAVGRGAWVNRSARALPPLGLGLVLLTWVALWEPGGLAEALISAAASGLLITAHWLNVRCSRPSCACPVDHLPGHTE